MTTQVFHQESLEAGDCLSSGVDRMDSNEFILRDGENTMQFEMRHRGLGWRADSESFEAYRARRLREDAVELRQDATHDSGEGDDDGGPEPDAPAAEAAFMKRKTEAWKAPRAPRATREQAAPGTAPSIGGADDVPEPDAEAARVAFQDKRLNAWKQVRK